jgi:hypothetical protein
MPYNVEPLRGTVPNLDTALTATGFAKKCVHGHWMHTPNNAPLPEHNADYHLPVLNGLMNHRPDQMGEHGQENLALEQYHEKDLTGRGYTPSMVANALKNTDGALSLCPHGGLSKSDSGDCEGAHDIRYMRGVERNLSPRETTQHLINNEWFNHPTYTHLEGHYDDDDEDYSDFNRTPRSEEQLVAEEPERVAGIRERINKVMALTNTPKFQKSDYTAQSFPSGTFYGRYRLDSSSPEQASHDGMYGGVHTVIGYHKGVAVGKLEYNSKGEVNGWYVDHRHQNSPVSVKMLAEAHQHLLELGNPIGMLKSDHTTSNSAAVIRKVDPDSTYLRQPEADRGWNDEVEWNPNHNDDRIHPLFPEHTERRSREEWRDLSETTGLNIHELHAINPDAVNRGKADLHELGDEAASIYHAYNDDDYRSQKQAEMKVRLETRDAIPSRIAAFSIPAGYLGDTANLETQSRRDVAATIGHSNPHPPAWRMNSANHAGLDVLASANDLAHSVDQTRRQINATRFRNSEHQRQLVVDADIRAGENSDEKLAERVGDNSAGVWMGDDVPTERTAEERARALIANRSRRQQ